MKTNRTISIDSELITELKAKQGILSDICEQAVREYLKKEDLSQLSIEALQERLEKNKKTKALKAELQRIEHG